MINSHNWRPVPFGLKPELAGKAYPRFGIVACELSYDVPPFTFAASKLFNPLAITPNFSVAKAKMSDFRPVAK